MKTAGEYSDNEESRRKSTTKLGYVHLGYQRGIYKIGKTNSLLRRRAELSTQRPDPITYLAYIETNDPLGVEEYWHKRFKNKNYKKEWFKLTRSDVGVFKNWRIRHVKTAQFLKF